MYDYSPGYTPQEDWSISMKFKQWLKIGVDKRNDNFDAFYDFASQDVTYPWKKSYEKQLEYLMNQNVDVSYLEVLRDAYFAYMTVWL